jgi:hypothetical protein
MPPPPRSSLSAWHAGRPLTWPLAWLGGGHLGDKATEGEGQAELLAAGVAGVVDAPERPERVTLGS